MTIPNEVAAVLAEMRAKGNMRWAAEIESALTKAEAVATVLHSDPYDDTGSKGPWFSIQDWARLRELSPNTKLYAHVPPAEPVASVPDGFLAFPDHVPAPNTQCVVLTAFKGRLHPSVDTWEMQSESPVSWSSATIETGYDWSDMGADVLYWKPVGELPAYPTNQQGAAP